MPYIEQSGRELLKEDDPLTVGELNYAISKLCDDYLARNGGTRYAGINDIVGVLECAKLEFYRRLAAPYEDKKMEENGDVYSPHLITHP